MPEQRTVEFRMAPPADLARRCIDANKALLVVQWAIEDTYQQCDGDEAIVDIGQLSAWKRTLRDANAALALAAVALGSLTNECF